MYSVQHGASARPLTAVMPQRKASLDLARLVLAMMVVLGHSMVFIDVSFGAFAIFENGIARLIVPFFLMLSGYFFSSTLERGIWPWARGILSLYLVWSAIFLPILIFMGDFSVTKLIFYLVFGYGHLWFLPAMLLAGVMLYAVRDWSPRAILYLALACLALGMTIQFAMNLALSQGLIGLRNGYFVLPRNGVTFGFPYFAFGYLLTRLPRPSFLRDRDLPFWLAGALALLIIESLIRYNTFGLFGYYDVLWTVPILAPLLFIIVAKVDLPLDAAWMAPLSAAIYLVHPIFIVLLDQLVDLSYTPKAFLALALTTAAAAGIVALNRRLRMV